MGSSASTLPSERAQVVLEMARDLGHQIAQRDLVVFTGETSGLPFTVAKSARASGGLTVGVAAAGNESDHFETYGALGDTSDVVIFTGFGLKGRNVISVRSADIVIIISGSIGTLNEFTIAYDEGKIIGVLSGTGGTADLIPEVLKACPKTTRSIIEMDTDPGRLLDLCLEHFKQRQP